MTENRPPLPAGNSGSLSDMGDNLSEFRFSDYLNSVMDESESSLDGAAQQQGKHGTVPDLDFSGATGNITCELFSQDQLGTLGSSASCDPSNGRVSIYRVEHIPTPFFPAQNADASFALQNLMSGGVNIDLSSGHGNSHGSLHFPKSANNYGRGTRLLENLGTPNTNELPVQQPDLPLNNQFSTAAGHVQTQFPQEPARSEADCNFFRSPMEIRPVQHQEVRQFLPLDYAAEAMVSSASSTARSSVAFSKGIYTCRTCGSSFESINDHNHHHLKHYRRHICTHFECNERFSTAGELRSHKKRDHPPPFYCAVQGCNRAEGGSRGPITRSDNFNVHIRTVHNPERQQRT